MTAPLLPCGTVAAFQRHIRAGEDPCQECKTARAAYARSRYVPRPQPLEPHGTPGAYVRHLRHGEETCQPCRDAYAARRATAPPPGTHGTNGGYVGHLKAGEPACEECVEAHREYAREWRAKRARRRTLDAAWAEVLAEAGVL